MNQPNEYNVTLTYLRSSKQPAYTETVTAVTQAEAKFKAIGSARSQGWKGEPVKTEAVIVRRVAA